MAISVLTGGQAPYWLANRRGTIVNGVVYNGTVADLAVGDYLPGSRAYVSVTGATTGTAPNQVRALTLTRLGSTMPVSWPATAPVQLIRGS